MDSHLHTKPAAVAPSPSTAMAAVAFQDHLLKDLSIGTLSGSLKPQKFSVNAKLRLQEKRRKLALKNIKSTVDTGLSKKTCSKPKQTNENDEYVLDPFPRPLTLAQKFGLIPHSKDQEKLLTENEWKVLKDASHQREDFKNPCVICKDDFRLEDQVLLSCSHVFHRACLQAFERFSGKKTCPMCRRESYQTRVVHEGTKFFKQKSATRIQACWRGYVVRKWYRVLRRTVPPKDLKLRRKFYENKLSEITDRMVAMTATDRIDRFLDDIDQSVAESRNVFRYFDKSILNHVSEEEWYEIEFRAVERGATECPICLRLLHLSSCFAKNEVPISEESKHKRTESIALLSCSHVFHATCLDALETFSVDCNVAQPQTASAIPSDTSVIFGTCPSSFKCPVCRAVYLKRIL